MKIKTYKKMCRYYMISSPHLLKLMLMGMPVKNNSSKVPYIDTDDVGVWAEDVYATRVNPSWNILKCILNRNIYNNVENGWREVSVGLDGGMAVNDLTKAPNTKFGVMPFQLFCEYSLKPTKKGY